METIDATNEVMPNFSEEEETNSETSSEQKSKKRGPAKKIIMTEEQKKARQDQYYQKNKEQRLKYKQTMRGALKVPSNRCFLHTHYLPRFIQQGKNKPRANLDFINYGGSHRTLTITQPTDELILLLKTQLKLPFEESFNGTQELDEEAEIAAQQKLEKEKIEKELAEKELEIVRLRSVRDAMQKINSQVSSSVETPTGP